MAKRRGAGIFKRETGLAGQMAGLPQSRKILGTAFFLPISLFLALSLTRTRHLVRSDANDSLEESSEEDQKRSPTIVPNDPP